MKGLGISMDPTILRGGKIGDGGRLEGERFVSRGGGSLEKKELISRGPGSNSGRDLPRDTLSAPTLDKKWLLRERARVQDRSNSSIFILLNR